jgi:hypothetical protein
MVRLLLELPPIAALINARIEIKRSLHREARPYLQYGIVLPLCKFPVCDRIA